MQQSFGPVHPKLQRKVCSLLTSWLFVLVLYDAWLPGLAGRAGAYGGGDTYGTSTNNNDKFVKAVGNRFYLDGKVWYFQGTNHYWLGPSSVGKISEENVEGIFHDHAAKGVRVVRLWGFGHGWDHMTVDSQGKWTLNDWSFRRLDYVIAMAAKYGVRVIFPFVNFEEDLTGMQFFVDHTLGKQNEKEQFYVNSQVLQRYTDYVRSIMYHWNPVTGKTYKDDPTILAWELANEPHTRDGFETWWSWPSQYGDVGLTIGKGQIVGRLVNQWICKVATMIKNIDNNHMVTTGEEGYRVFGPWTADHNWINNGLKGVDFEMNARCPDVDFMTVHVYPDNWGIPFKDVWWVVDNYMKDRAKVAHDNNKPIVMEEYGCCKSDDYKGKRSQVIKMLHQAADDAGFAGCLVWQVMPWDGLTQDHNYDFTYNDDGGWEIIQHALYLNKRWW